MGLGVNARMASGKLPSDLGPSVLGDRPLCVLLAGEMLLSTSDLSEEVNGKSALVAAREADMTAKIDGVWPAQR